MGQGFQRRTRNFDFQLRQPVHLPTELAVSIGTGRRKLIGPPAAPVTELVIAHLAADLQLAVDGATVFHGADFVPST